TKHVARLFDRERSVRAEEAQPAAMQRRTDAERDADRLAEACGGLHQPHRNATFRRARSDRAGRRCHKIPQRTIIFRADDEYFAHRFRARHRQHETLYEIVDIDGVEVGLTVADEQEHALLHHLEHLEQANVTRPIDRAGAYHDHLNAAGAFRSATGKLGLELGFLIEVHRIEWRVFVRGDLLDAAVHADGRAIDEAPDARLLGSVEQVHRAFVIDLEEILIGAFAAKHRGDVENRVGARDETPQRILILKIALDDLQAWRGFDPLGVTHKRADRITVGQQTLDQRIAGEPGAAGDGDERLIAHGLHLRCKLG